jgi:hypothetical protein
MKEENENNPLGCASGRYYHSLLSGNQNPFDDYHIA